MSSPVLNQLIGALAGGSEEAIDPACGLGGTLAAVAPQTKRLYGIDTDPYSVAIAKMRLLVAGALDEKFAALNERMAAAIPNATLRRIADAGHTVHLEQPALFLNSVDEFLTDYTKIRGVT